MEGSGQARHLLKDLRTGARFLAQSALVRYLTGYNTTITIASAVATLGAVIYIKAALGLPAAASDQLYGLVGAVLAGGLALTTWLIGLLHDRLPKRRMILAGPALAGAAYLLFLLHPGPGAILPIFFIVSIGSACSLVPVPVFLASAVPNELRGRTYSFINALDALASLAAYSALAAVGLLLPPGVLLATAGAILLIGIPLCTFVLKGNRALREHELQR